MKRLWIPALAVLAMAALTMPSAAFAQVTFPDGVASGDVTQTRAILWTRVAGLTTRSRSRSRAGRTRPSAGRRPSRASSSRPPPVTGRSRSTSRACSPGTQYWYQFKKDADVSAGGHVQDRSGRELLEQRGVHLDRRLGPVQGGRSQPVQQLGDACCRPGARTPTSSSTSATRSTRTRATVRAVRRRRWPTTATRTSCSARTQNLTNLQKSTSTYPLIDDHEVQNDFAGQTVNPARYAAGLQAFKENKPIRETGLPHDPSCAGDPLYRTVKWGSEVELFITDQRSCRSASANVAATCGGDLGPTLPTAVRHDVPVQPVPDAEPAPGLPGGDQRPQPHDAGAGAEGSCSRTT